MARLEQPLGNRRHQYDASMKPRSLIRLQEEILKVSDDSTLFARGLPANIRTGHDFFASLNLADGSKWHGMLADSLRTLCTKILGAVAGASL